MSQTVCLNMIVKDESHIIRETLEKLCSKIKFDYWVISDTGSTDDTPKIITDFFKEKNIIGELYIDEWRDFGYNRSLALKEAFNKTDYLVIFDADDEIVGDIVFPSPLLYDCYHFQFGDCTGVKYTRTQLVNNRKKWKYIGVLHELIESDGFHASTDLIRGNYYTISGRSSSRNKDPLKYYKDAKILEKAYEEAKEKDDKIYNRYAFYCANSFNDAGHKEEATEWYKKVLKHDNWEQEKYYSCLKIYENLRELNREEEGIYYLVKGFKYDRERVECLYHLLVHYCCNDMDNIAFKYYTIVQTFFEDVYMKNHSSINWKLFIDRLMFDLRVPYYMIIICSRVGQHQVGIKMYKHIFNVKPLVVDKWWIGNLLFNMQFFTKHIQPDEKQEFSNLFVGYIEHLRKYKYDLEKEEVMKKYEELGYKPLPQVINLEPNKKFTIEECKKSNNILIYSGFSTEQWNYTYSLENALGGSETAVISIAHNFPKNYNVYVLGDVKNEEVDNVTYVHLYNGGKLFNEKCFNTIIVSRYVAFYEMFKMACYYRSYVWAHDTNLIHYGCELSSTEIVKKHNERINGCICLTEWHKQLFGEKYPEMKDKITLINNGIPLEKISTIEKQKNKFVYTSCTERGLERVVNLWSNILELAPDAKLYISSYNKFPKNKEEEELETIMKKYPESIIHMGKLSKPQLYELIGSAEYWFYPTNWPETSCITAMEMLASKVICIYYPFAGLIDTMNGQGIKTSYGNEIEDIKNIMFDEKRKNELRENGYKYINSTCSWRKRLDKWCELLKIENNNNDRKKKICIYNSFPFHHEMFGFIFHYASLNELVVDVFTNRENDLGWLEYYKDKFGNNINILDVDEYDNNKCQKEYRLIFLTTDDDKKFKDEWFSNKVIVLNHTSSMRRNIFNQNSDNVFNIAKFNGSNLKYIIPCYPIFDISDKNVSENEIVVTIIGFGDVVYGKYTKSTNILNRFKPKSTDYKIVINIIGRDVNKLDFGDCNQELIIRKYENLNTTEMINLLKNTNYVLINYNNNELKNDGHKCAGSIQSSFSTLCKPIISRTTNNYFQFRNAVEFDFDNDDDIILDNNVELSKIKRERNEYILYYNNQFKKLSLDANRFIPKKIYQTWETKDFEPNFVKLLDTWKKNNPEYEIILHDKSDRENFIKERFDNDVFETYCKLIPGGFKSDLWSYCVLYVNGGFYVDIDTICFDSLDKVICEETKFISAVDLNKNPKEGTHNLTHGFMGVEPKSQIMLNAIEKIVYNIKNNIEYISKLDYTACGVLGRAVNKYLNLNEENEFVGKEGEHNNKEIKFLKFEEKTEFMIDVDNKVKILQNKNGNNEIIRLYNIECEKVKSINWVNCSKISE